MTAQQPERTHMAEGMDLARPVLEPVRCNFGEYANINRSISSSSVTANDKVIGLPFWVTTTGP
jgi:hypothetical protein